MHACLQWQYRLLVGSLVSLLLLFGLLLSASLLYGFGMTYPRIRVADLRVSDVRTTTSSMGGREARRVGLVLTDWWCWSPTADV